MNAKQRIDSLFAAEKSLAEISKTKTFTRALNRDNPGNAGAPLQSPYPRISTPTTKAALWGGEHNLTLSLLKTDVIDRRYVDREHVTMADVMEGAYSEKNKDLNDMPMAGMTRPSFSILHKDGGRYNYGLWSEVYSFPCQKPVGQIIVKADELKDTGLPGSPQAVQHMKNGLTIETEPGETYIIK